MKELHRRWVANHLKNKARELRYFLEMIVEGSMQSRQSFRAQKPVQDNASQRVIYGFSGFANSVQSLKDSFETATGESLSWGEVGRLRHGAFIKEARNAATHDGNPVVNGWVDGEYYTLGKIIRLDSKDKVLTIEPPLLPTVRVCSEFAEDLCALMARKLAAHRGRADLTGAVLTEDMLNHFFESPLVPEFAKELFRRDKEQSLLAVQNSTHDPIQDASAELTKIAAYCASL